MRVVWAVIFGWVFFWFGSASADTFTDLKTRVSLRAEAIRTLKERGVIREGSGGLLVTQGGQITAPQERLIEDENTDRKQLFDILGQRSGRSPAEVAALFEQMAGHSVGVSSEAESGASTRSADGEPRSGEHALPSTRAGALPMKVMARAFSSLYASPDPTASKVQEQVAAFSIYYVYQKVSGWYQVGERREGVPLGWISEADAIEWKQNLVVKFTHPEGREPVLLFKDSESLLRIVQQPSSERVRAVQTLYAAIDDGEITRDFPVESMEPRRAIDAQAQFYVLPIVAHRSVELDGREGRLLQIAAATRQRGSGDLRDRSIRNELIARPNFSGATARGVLVDVVFVMDLTRSMGPFADQTVKMMEDCVKSIGADWKAAEAIRFGFWGYRDSPNQCKGIEFNTRNYTPELQPLDRFTKTLWKVQETKADSLDYEEDVFAGVADAIQETKWRPGAIRMLILVGDAPGREPGATGVRSSKPKGTASGMDAASIRRLADGSRVYVTALYLNAPKWRAYAEVGAEQFRVLARNPNTSFGAENFRVLDTSNPEVYRATAATLAQGVVDFVRFSQEGAQGEDLKDSEEQSSDDEIATAQAGKKAGRQLARNMFRGAMIEWLGSQDAAKAPSDVTAWCVDKDLLDPMVQSLDVQVFLTKNQLNDLKVVLDRVVDAAIRGKISGEDFFEALRAVVAAAAADPVAIANGETLAKSSLVPAFLKNLPYQSTVMSMSSEAWRQLSPDAQEQFLNTLLAKLRYYQLVHDNPDRWVALNEKDSPDDWVAAIPLDQLP